MKKSYRRGRRTIRGNKTDTGEFIPISKIKEDKKESHTTRNNNSENYTIQKPAWQRFFIKLSSIAAFWLLVLGIIFVIGAGIAAAMIYSYSDPSLLETLEDQDINMSSVIYALDKDNNYVEYETLYSNEHRSWTNSEDISQYLKDATISIEDKRFYTHPGIDIRRTAKSVIEFATAKILNSGTGNIAGGSTLTQQLIKNVTGDDQNSVERKLEEMLRALYLERNFSKEQILEFYLNTVYFNNNCYGVGTASKYYFDKEPVDLTILESAALISITKSPDYYDPYKNPEHNKTRRNQVLYEMWKQKYISEADYLTYSQAELDLKDITIGNATSERDETWSYATDMVFLDVVNDLMTNLSIPRSEAVKKLYTGGLKIYSTVDLEIQGIMDDFFTDTDNLSKERHYVEETQQYVYPEVAMEVMDPKTGNVLGIIGGRGQKIGKLGLNRATGSYRQPGSSIKPLTVYGYAMENNIITQGTIVSDRPTNTYEGKSWPANANGRYSGDIPVYKALALSLNAPAVRILDMIGVETSFNFAKSMLGMESLLPEDMARAPLSLGALTRGETVQEMTAGFSVYANNGIYSSPRSYTTVENYKGEVVLDNSIENKVVFSPQTAFLITDILRYATKTVTFNKNAQVKGIDTAGKTGTTTYYVDRWFIGYTPYYLSGIWWGYDDNYSVSDSDAFQTRIWGKVMNKIHSAKGYTSGEFTQPGGIVQTSYCTKSGLLPGPYCGGGTTSGFFKEGTEPTKRCTSHYAPSKDEETPKTDTTPETETPTPEIKPPEQPTPKPDPIVPTPPIVTPPIVVE